MITDNTWTPDLEVAVCDDELVLRFDHLPPAEVDWEDGGVILHDPEAVHCFHVRLPDGLDHGAFEARPSDGTLELRVQLPASEAASLPSSRNLRRVKYTTSG